MDLYDALIQNLSDEPLKRKDTPNMKGFPKLCLQRYKDGRRDTYYVRLPDENGKMKRINLGPWDEPASKERYKQMEAAWLRGEGIDLTKPTPPAPPDSLLVVELFELFLTAHQNSFTRDAKHHSSTLERFKASENALGSYADLPVTQITTKTLRQWAYGLLDSKRYCRDTINAYLRCVKAVFAWGEIQDKVPEETNALVQSVKGLRTGGKVLEPRQPVDFADVEAVLPYLHPTPQTIIRLLMRTGARPTEICGLSIADLDRDSVKGVWIYKPKTHKNILKGQIRTIVFDRESIDLLSAYITAKKIRTGRVFRPIKTVKKTTPALHYTYSSLCAAVHLACEKAGLKEHWTPYQIRHTVATKLEAEIGIEAARAVLGHSSALTTSGYIHRDLNTVIKLAQRGGIVRLGEDKPNP